MINPNFTKAINWNNIEDLIDKNADDFEMTLDHGAVLVDAASATLLSGSTLNFQDELWSRQFVIENPNARQTCGCGSSFAA